ncbi:hypothetical protein AAG570_005328 [Ranatra chinensis]|uniref:Uncharacterized protein n=1 Tax=Ranatra chinensis TaxID=642074 RepID=A0ABD0Y050_9HEMI
MVHLAISRNLYGTTNSEPDYSRLTWLCSALLSVSACWVEGTTRPRNKIRRRGVPKRTGSQIFLPYLLYIETLMMGIDRDPGDPPMTSLSLRSPDPGLAPRAGRTARQSRTKCEARTNSAKSKSEAQRHHLYALPERGGVPLCEREGHAPEPHRCERDGDMPAPGGHLPANAQIKVADAASGRHRNAWSGTTIAKNENHV